MFDREKYKKEYYQRRKARYQQWYQLNRGRLISRVQESRREDPEAYREYYNAYNARMKIQHREFIRSARKSQKLRALQMISGLEVPSCKNCGCSDIRVLEANHKNLGGRQEYIYYKRKGTTLYLEVITGRRGTKDLEVLCRVCNSAHYLEKKFDIHYSITFKGLGLSDKERALSRLERFGDK